MKSDKIMYHQVILQGVPNKKLQKILNGQYDI